MSKDALIVNLKNISVSVILLELKQSNKYYISELYNSNLKQKFVLYSDEWYTKRDISLSMIRSREGLTVNKVWGRKCKFQTISPQKGKTFFDANHISGNARSSFYYGLVHNGEVVSAISFRKPFTKRSAGVVEIARFYSKLDTSVVGGLSKLLQHSKHLFPDIPL